MKKISKKEIMEKVFGLKPNLSHVVIPQVFTS